MRRSLFAALLLAAGLPAQPLPQVSIDLGTVSARIEVQGPSGDKDAALLVGLARLPVPVPIPGVAGALEVDPGSAALVGPVRLDALGRFGITYNARLPRGLRVHVQALTVESPSDLRLSAAASDHVPSSDGLFLDHLSEAGARAPGTVPEVIRLPDGRVRLYVNIPGGIGSATSTDGGLTFQTDPGLRLTHPNAADRVSGAVPLQLPDGRIRLYYEHVYNEGTPNRSEEIKSAVSTDGLLFTIEPGNRYVPAPVDRGQASAMDVLCFGGGVVRIYYVGDWYGENNVRTAVSTDGGWTFTHEARGILPDQRPGPTFVDPDVLRLRDGRYRCLAMRGANAIFAFTSLDGLRWTIENGGAPVITAGQFTNPPTNGIVDPASLLLPDGSLRTYLSASAILSAVTTPETGRGRACPGAALCGHDIRVATSPDGLAWTMGPTLLAGGSVPAPARHPDGRLLVYFVDGSTTPEHLGVFELVNGTEVRDLRRVTELSRPNAGRWVDPAPFFEGGQLHLYFTVLGPSVQGIARGRLEPHGSVLTWERYVVPPPTTYVDPDVVRDAAGTWAMFAFRGPGSDLLTSPDGLSFSFAASLTDLLNRGLTRPLGIGGGSWRMYTFDQLVPPPNAVRAYRSTDLVRWTQEGGVLLTAPAGRTLTDPQVVPEGAGHLMVMKTQ